MVTNEAIEASLIEAVCDSPHDDAPRLAYADWIEHHAADERAARADYIRRTIRLYREDNELDDASSVRLLTSARQVSWSNGVSALGLNYYEFVRGFVASVQADASTLLQKGSEIAKRCPLQYINVLRGAKDHLAELVQAPWMAHVFSLDLGGNDLTDDDVRLLAHSSLNGLRWVNLDRNPVTTTSAEEMASATVAGRFPELHTLHLPLEIYDDVEGGSGMASVQMTVYRPEGGKRLRALYGDLAWLTPRPPGFRGALKA